MKTCEFEDAELRCRRIAKWRVFRGVYEEQLGEGHLVCRHHALQDTSMTAIEPAIGRFRVVLKG